MAYFLWNHLIYFYLPVANLIIKLAAESLIRHFPKFYNNRFIREIVIALMTINIRKIADIGSEIFKKIKK